MSDLQEQLAELRQRMAHASANCNRKFSGPSASAALAIEETWDNFVETPRPGHEYVQEWMCGEEVETEFGKPSGNRKTVRAASQARQRCRHRSPGF